MSELANKQLCDKALALKENIETGYIQLGAFLSDIRENLRYKPFWDTYGEFLMEIDISEGNASKMVSVYRKMVLEYDIPEEQLIKANGLSKLYEIVKVSDSKENALEWLDKASVLSRTHLQQEIREERTGVNTDECEHEFRTLNICKKCNTKEEVYDK